MSIGNFASDALEKISVWRENAHMKQRGRPRQHEPKHARPLLRELRGEMTQEALADALGVSVSTVRRWEAGDQSIPDSQVRAILHFFRVPRWDLFGEDAYDHPRPDVRHIVNEYLKMNPTQREVVQRFFGFSEEAERGQDATPPSGNPAPRRRANKR